jgi:hypothetical protein
MSSKRLRSSSRVNDGCTEIEGVLFISPPWGDEVRRDLVERDLKKSTHCRGWDSGSFNPTHGSGWIVQILST